MGRKSARAMFMMTILICEALVVLFAGTVANGLDLAPSRAVWLATIGLMMLAFVAAGLSRGPAGVWVGWLVQAVLVAISFAVPMMWVLALVFVALWIASLRVGARIDRERAERDAAAVH
ncbi:MAG: DUF4233 domain-containing protein [Ruaniaceae bacterium]|nr:DUF4233 domain-containing protein [Ruaniaceae bacterium]